MTTFVARLLVASSKQCAAGAFAPCILLRLDAARTLRTNGQSYRQIAESLGVGASTIRENLSKAV